MYPNDDTPGNINDLALNLPPELFNQLKEEAQQRNITVEQLLTEHLKTLFLSANEAQKKK